MISKIVESELNKQIQSEGYSSQLYLSMACWAERQGLAGVADFMYKHSDEERFHMLKLVKYINERGGQSVVPSLNEPPRDFSTLRAMFEELLAHEMEITNKINELVNLTLQEKDYTTHNFLQWYVSEQLEEEALARAILDKLKIIGDERGGGLYMFDRDIAKMTVTSANDAGAGAQ
jgi:ferritin